MERGLQSSCWGRGMLWRGRQAYTLSYFLSSSDNEEKSAVSGSGSSPAKLVFFSVSSILMVFFFLFFSFSFQLTFHLLQDAFPASSQACSTFPSYFSLGFYNPLYLLSFFFLLNSSLFSCYPLNGEFFESRNSFVHLSS